MSRRLPAAWIAGAAAIGLGIVPGCGGSPPSPSASAPAETQTREPLDAAFTVARRQPNLTSLVVSHRGSIVRQEYFNGGGPAVAQDVRSVTKSVTSLLVGIGLEQGCVRSIDSTLGEALGSRGPADPAKAAVTIRHLLTMSSGIGGDELRDINEYNRWSNAPNQLAYVWDQPLAAQPGTRFSYYSPAYSVLSPILTAACGQPVPDLARDRLLNPLGLSLRGWELDRQGFANGAAGLMVTPLDMIAIGNLVLGEGQVNGQQIVPASWIREATRPQIATNVLAYLSGYGFGWWTGQVAGSDFTLAHGWGGQFILVVPRVQLVVTATSRWQGINTATASAQWIAVLDIIMQGIVPAF